jgi:Domain of unknown function (DUF6458)
LGYGGIGFGIFLVAAGAILRYAVTADVSGIDLEIVGVILMVAGAVLFFLSLFFVIWARQSSSTGGPPPPPPPSGY